MFWKASWVWALTVKELGAKTIIDVSRALGLTDLLVLVKSVTGRVDTTVLKQLLEEPRNNPRIHAWLVCFKDESRAEALPHNESYRKYLLDIVKTILEHYDVDGIHLDYIRYPGNARDKWPYVSSFVKSVRKIIEEVKPDTILSIASKAEGFRSKEELESRALYYGQNYRDLSSVVDVFFPMTYYLDYNIEPLEAVVAALWVKELTGRIVAMGVQLHPGEHPLTRGKIPSIEDVKVQLLEAKRKGLDGVCFFRFKYLYERLDEMKHVLSLI